MSVMAAFLRRMSLEDGWDGEGTLVLSCGSLAIVGEVRSEALCSSAGSQWANTRITQPVSLFPNN